MRETASFDGKKILLGISGGIAAYKAADLASKLTGGGATVRTIMTDAACKLVGPATLGALTGQPVYTSLWGAKDHTINHIQLVDWAECIVIAPATADMMAKMACGICDDLLSTTMCVCWDKKVLLAPAMNTKMWANPIVQKNLKVLTDELGYKTVGPEQGRLACGTTGPGRMAEVPAILAVLMELLK